MRLRTLSYIIILVVSALMQGCMEWDYGLADEPVTLDGDGLFILNEGNFQYGNSSLSYYNPDTDSLVNDVFVRVNGMKLGDVAQSMTMYDGKAWIVVNNSHVIFAIDPETGLEKGRITGLTSPRYIHFVSETKAYVTQLWDNRIAIVNPSTFAVTGYIEVPEMKAESASTEQMVAVGDYVYCTCWSYNNTILRIDTRTDSIVDRLTVGLQPRAIVVDKNNMLWTITDGGYEGSPFGYETPRLYRIDPFSFSVVETYDFKLGDSPVGLTIDSKGERLYWINADVWRMNVDAKQLPSTPVVKERRTRYYGLTVSPRDGDIYVADAIDYQQQGVVYRYDATGRYVSSFYVGVNPCAFCWK